DHMQLGWKSAFIVIATLACSSGTACAVPSVPYATFDRAKWSPDGTSAVVQSTLIDLEISPNAPLRVDTLLLAPDKGLTACLTPTVTAFATNAARDSFLFADTYGLYALPVDGS